MGACSRSYAIRSVIWKGIIMGKTISVALQKGGVGKTTTVINLSAALAERGKKVLVIDIDPQCNTTSGFGLDKENEENTAYTLLLGETSIHQCIKRIDLEQIDLIPSNKDIAAIGIEMLGFNDKEVRLRKAIKEIRDKYDYIFIDCPPSLNLLTINAFVASDTVLIPTQCEYYALEGLGLLIHSMNLVRERMNPILEIEGIVITMHDSRNNLSRDVISNVKNYFPYKTFNTMIPRNIRLAEAPSHGMSVLRYAPEATGSEAYRMLAEEIIERNEER